LEEGLPPAPGAPQSAPSGGDLEGQLRAALQGGQEALLAAASASGKKLSLAPLRPPGEITLSGSSIEIGLDRGQGLEWFSYLSCKALRRSDANARAGMLGESERASYRWTAGEEELCLWALEGTREHLKAEVDHAPSPDPSLARLDAAATAGHMRGFALVEF